MINVPKFYVNYVTTFTISHITNKACVVHIKHTFDIKIDMGMENKYTFGETFVHLEQIKCHLKLTKKAIVL